MLNDDTTICSSSLSIGFSGDLDATEQSSEQPSIFRSVPRDINMYGVELKDKGDSWENVGDKFNILDPDYFAINTYVIAKSIKFYSIVNSKQLL